MLIRREHERDIDAVGTVTAAAFGAATNASLPPEVTLVSRLRDDDGYLPALSLVAVEHGEVIGHVMCTRGYVDGRPATGLGP